MSQTLKARAYQHILSKIAAGGVRAGGRLSAAALAKELGVSHIPVREAISQLHSEGLIDQVPRKGAFARRPERSELVEMIELRSVLECNAAAQAALRIDDAQIYDLEKQVRLLEELA